MVGRTIGKYRVVDKIGEGGMGTVWKAEDTSLGRLAALKTLSRSLAEDEEARTRLVREAQAASSLNHPNITTMADQAADYYGRVLAGRPSDSQRYEALRSLGCIAARRGDRETAMAYSEQIDGLDVPYERGYETYCRAAILCQLGEFDRALALLRRAYDEGHTHGPTLHRDIDFEPMRDHAPFREWVRPKG